MGSACRNCGFRGGRRDRLLPWRTLVQGGISQRIAIGGSAGGGTPRPMDYPEPLIEGLLVRRYQRFLADVELSDGRTITAHTPNTGSMKGCSEPGSRVWLRDTANPRRKYVLAWELVETSSGVLVGINTGLPSRLVAESIREGLITELQGYDTLLAEVPYGLERSRVDLLLKTKGGGCCYVEVKNVTLVEGRTALFPDAVSARGTKHLRELAAMAEAGHRAVIFFCVQRADATELRPADTIDPRYGHALRQALARGVEALAYDARISPQTVALRGPLPVVCPSHEGRTGAPRGRELGVSRGCQP